MQKDEFLSLTEDERKLFLSKASADAGIPPEAVEKDWWVTKVLRAVSMFEYHDEMIFKGGTSLSKGFGIIYRFSEDIDLSLDRGFLGFPGDLTKNQVSDRLRRAAKSFVLERLYSDLPKALESVGIPRNTYTLSNNDNGSPTQDPVQIFIDYVSVFNSSGYINSRVILEISGRSFLEAVKTRDINSILSEKLPESPFASLPFSFPTVEPERTFIEKVCLLHEEFRKPVEQIRCSRMSRHLYDLYMMCDRGIDKLALNNEALFRDIVMHRFIYNRIDGVNYNTETPGGFNIIPINEVIDKWREDFVDMSDSMIYGESKPTFDDIIDRMCTLNKDLNDIRWREVPVFTPGERPYLKISEDTVRRHIEQ